MKTWTDALLAGALALATFALPAMAQSKTATTTLSVGVLPESSLTVSTTTTTLTQLTNATLFGDYTGTTELNYKIRTTLSGGTGAITAQVNEFTGNGPKVATDLSYSSINVGVGTPVTNQTASTTGANVITFAENARSAKAGNDATVTWKLADDPQFETGSYTSLVTFTISAS